MRVWRQRGYGKSLYFQFCYECKTALNKDSKNLSKQTKQNKNVLEPTANGYKEGMELPQRARGATFSVAIPGGLSPLLCAEQ